MASITIQKTLEVGAIYWIHLFYCQVSVVMTAPQPPAYASCRWALPTEDVFGNPRHYLGDPIGSWLEVFVDKDCVIITDRAEYSRISASVEKITQLL